MSNLDRRRLKANLTTVCIFLRSGEGGGDLFSLGSREKMHEKNGSKLHQGMFRLDNGNNFFAERVVKLCNRLPREADDALILSAFKRNLDNALNNLLYLLVILEMFRKLD